LSIRQILDFEFGLEGKKETLDEIKEYIERKYPNDLKNTQSNQKL
jgi:hypothetical protein